MTTMILMETYHLLCGESCGSGLVNGRKRPYVDPLSIYSDLHRPRVVDRMPIDSHDSRFVVAKQGLVSPLGDSVSIAKVGDSIVEPDAVDVVYCEAGVVSGADYPSKAVGEPLLSMKTDVKISVIAYPSGNVSGGWPSPVVLFRENPGIWVVVELFKDFVLGRIRPLISHFSGPKNYG